MNDSAPESLDSPPVEGTTFIAQGTRFAGDFSGAGNIMVCGEVNGDCDWNGPITLAVGGMWTGRLRGTDVVIAGTVEGDVVATGKLEIAATARIRGSANGAAISVKEGAIIDGEINVRSRATENA